MSDITAEEMELDRANREIDELYIAMKKIQAMVILEQDETSQHHHPMLIYSNIEYIIEKVIGPLPKDAA